MGELSMPSSWKIGPSMKGFQATFTPCRAAAASMRITLG
jgi:hypothetical protein